MLSISGEGFPSGCRSGCVREQKNMGRAQRPGVTVRDVAELLGDTEEMVRRHYAAWVSERQERLTGVLKEAFAKSQGRN